MPKQKEFGNYVLKIENGFLLVQNQPSVSFSIEFEGKDFEPFPSDHPKFVLDGKAIQLVTIPCESVWKPKDNLDVNPTVDELLESHKDWETNYLSNALKFKLNTTSSFIEIAPDRKVMVWSFKIPKNSNSSPTNYLFITTVIGENIIGFNSASDDFAGQNSCCEYLLESLKTLKTSNEPYNIEELSNNI